MLRLSLFAVYLGAGMGKLRPGDHMRPVKQGILKHSSLVANIFAGILPAFESAVSCSGIPRYSYGGFAA